jgi:hypothetical protein
MERKTIPGGLAITSAGAGHRRGVGHRGGLRRRSRRDGYYLIFVARRRDRPEALAEGLRNESGVEAEPLVDDFADGEALSQVEAQVMGDERLTLIVRTLRRSKSFISNSFLSTSQFLLVIRRVSQTDPMDKTCTSQLGHIADHCGQRDCHPPIRRRLKLVQVSFPSSPNRGNRKRYLPRENDLLQA